MNNSPVKKSVKSDNSSNWDMRKRYEQVTVKCEFCGEAFNTSKAYQDHAKQQHLKEVEANWLPCNQCSVLLPSRLAMVTHNAKVHSKAELRDSSGQFSCNYCGRTYKNLLDLNKHCLKDHMDIVKKEWIPCNQCNLYFRNDAGLRRHSSQKHPKESSSGKSRASVQCSFCPKVFSCIDPLYPHVNRYHLEEIEKQWFYDPLRKMYFPTQPQDTQRRLKDGIVCIFCSKTFTNMGTLAAHANSEHLPEVEKEWFFDPTRKRYYPHTPQRQKREKPSKETQCSFCPDMFKSMSVLYQHANTQHKEVVQKTWFLDEVTGSYYPVRPEVRRKKLGNGGGTISCEFCSESVCNNYVPHANRFHRKIIAAIWPGHCEECKMYFPSIKSLDSHNLAKHKNPTSSFRKRKIIPGREVIMCEFCSKTFFKPINYWRHSRLEHLEHISLFWSHCSICQLHFPTSDTLTKHMASVHYEGASEKKQPKKVCQFCPSTFSMVSEYTRHANDLHVEVIEGSWLKCQICGYFLQTEACLARHTGRHDGFSAKQITCAFCTTKFQYYKKYYKHANDTHPEEVVNSWQFCIRCLQYFPATHHMHFRETSTPRMTSCKFCSAVFQKRADHVLHCNADHLAEIVPSWSICARCDVYFPSRMSLKSHRKNCGKSKKVKETSSRAKSSQKSDEITEQLAVDDVKSEPPVRKSGRKRKGKSYDDFDLKANPSPSKRARCKIKEIVKDLDISDRDHGKVPVKRSARQRKTVVMEDFVKIEDDGADLSDLDLPPDEQDSEWMPLAVKMEETSISNQGKFNNLDIERGADCSDDENAPLSGRRRKKGGKTKSASYDEPEPKAFRDVVETVDGRGNVLTFQFDDNEQEDEDNFNGFDQDSDCEIPEPTFVVCSEEQVETTIIVEHLPADKIEIQDCDSADVSPFSADGGISSSCEPETSAVMEPEVKGLKWPMDLDKVNIEPEDLDDFRAAKSTGRGDKNSESSFGKRCSYKVPKSATNVKIVSTLDRNGTETKRVQCEYCTKTHINVYVYYLHVNTEHQELAMLYWFPCEACNKYFPSEQAIKKHNRIIHPDHSINKKLLCDFCSASLSNSFYLYRHVNRVHMDEVSKIWIECKVCGKFMPNPSAMGCHVQSRHPKYHKQIQDQMTPSRPSTVIDTVCDFCGLHYGLRSSLKDHVQFVHPGEIGKKVCQTQCKFCSEIFRDQELCYAHTTANHLDQIRAEKWINCFNCKQSFPTETVYVIHRFSCHQSKQSQITSLQCDFCIQTFCTSGEYYKHANAVHTEDLNDWQLCTNCDLKIPEERYSVHQECCNGNTLQPIQISYRESSGFQCDFCDKTYNKRKHLVVHVNAKHVEAVQDGPSKCQFCQAHMDSNLKLYTHVTGTHASQVVNNTDWVTCYFCKLFIPKGQYLGHKGLKHSGMNAPPDFSGKQVCAFCSQNFDNCFLYYLHANKEHSMYLSESNWVPCNRCRQFYPGMLELKHHKDSCSQKRKKNCLGRTAEISCPYCPQTFLRNHNYQYHLNRQHRENLVSSNWIPCPKCDTLFKTPSSMQAHFRMCKKVGTKVKTQDASVVYSRKKELQCSFCDKVCSSGQNFYIHNNTHHAKDIEESWFECDLCNMRFPTKNVLRFHMGHNMCNKSNKSVRIKCDFCTEYTTTKRRDLKKHCQAKHKKEIEENWLQCPKCKLYVGDTEHFKRHERRCIGATSEELGTKKMKSLLPCSFCSELFPKLSEYVEHANESHSGVMSEEALWSKCDICLKHIPHMWNLKKHKESCKG